MIVVLTGVVKVRVFEMSEYIVVVCCQAFYWQVNAYRGDGSVAPAPCSRTLTSDVYNVTDEKWAVLWYSPSSAV